ncbi:MAG: hypothetical protein M1825_005556 [Sarcosagium campestre]|nr:MAG: hypothetical protein M1825_005556 [Sarcosagium campestre]
MSVRPAAPRPKRAGETFARTHHLEADGPSSSKKPRFDVRNPSALAPDAPEDDAILDMDEIGKGGQQTKRNAVNLDGYDSDSSNEGFDARADAKAKQAKKRGAEGGPSVQEDTNDMFADLEDEFEDGDKDEDLSREGKKKDKGVRFLDVTEIEGQVAGSKAGGHVSADFSLDEDQSAKGKERERRERDSESDDEVNEDDKDVDEEVGAGGRKANAPKLDAFNMRGEMEEGRFDAQGNFVRKAADPDAVHDSWLEGVSKKDMKRASEAAAKRDEEWRQKSIADDQLLTSDLLESLIVRLERGETVLEALARLGRLREKQKPRWQGKNRNRKKQTQIHDMDVDAENENESESENPTEMKRRETVEAITEAADQLLTRGQTEIYDETRESLIRQYSRETGDAWVEAARTEDVHASSDGGLAPARQWEYRWTDKRDGGEHHGPYDGSTMAQWQEAGYLGENVEFRTAGDQGDWSRSVDFA